MFSSAQSTLWNCLSMIAWESWGRDQGGAVSCKIGPNQQFEISLHLCLCLPESHCYYGPNYNPNLLRFQSISGQKYHNSQKSRLAPRYPLQTSPNEHLTSLSKLHYFWRANLTRPLFRREKIWGKYLNQWQSKTIPYQQQLGAELKHPEKQSLIRRFCSLNMDRDLLFNEVLAGFIYCWTKFNCVIRGGNKSTKERKEPILSAISTGAMRMSAGCHYSEVRGEREY